MNNNDIPFNKNTTVRTEDGRVGRINGYENGEWKVLFEDGTEDKFLESKLKPIQILKG